MYCVIKTSSSRESKIDIRRSISRSGNYGKVPIIQLEESSGGAINTNNNN